MIRVVLLTFISITSCWCKGFENLNRGDSLLIASAFGKASPTLHLNQQLKHYTGIAMLNPRVANAPTGKATGQSQIPRYRQDEPVYGQRYLMGGFSTGIWIPTGRNRILGPHPSFGLVAGHWSGQWLWEIEMEFRFVDAAHDYKVVFQDTVRTTHTYFGGFIGFHVGYNIINLKRTSIYLMSGMGLEGFDSYSRDTVDPNNSDNEQSVGVSINSFNMNAGIGIQHFGKYGGFVGLELLCNFIHYQNPGGTPLDGNGVTLRLTLGGIHGF